MSHSKRNTSLAFFTAHERNELKGHWGSRTSRLTRESFLPFGSCQLCLLPARDPVACPSHGHLFCRECAMSNLLAQSKEIKRQRKEVERRQAQDAEEQALDEETARIAALADFERTQAGLGRLSKRDSTSTKRALEVDEEEVDRLEKRGSSKRKLTHDSSDLPSFWVASETPENKRAEVKKIKQTPSCPAATTDRPHDFGLKLLISVHFTEDTTTSDSEGPRRSCPACSKALSNATKAVLARPCGHVLCKPCSEKFQKAELASAHDSAHDDAVRCYVCQEDVTPGREIPKQKGSNGIVRGLVELSTEGTGFAGGGKAEVKKAGVAFQC